MSLPGCPALSPNILVANKVLINVADDDYQGSGTNYNFGTRNFGSFDGEKNVICAVFTAGGMANLTGVSIGGSGGTYIGGPTTGGQVCALYGRRMTGTSGNISVDFSTTANRCGIIVWEVIGAPGLTPYDTDTTTVSGTTASIALDIPARGAALLGARGNSTSNVMALTGGLTLDVLENAFQNANNAYLGASDEFDTEQIARSISVSLSPSGTISMIGASWGPA